MKRCEHNTHADWVCSDCKHYMNKRFDDRGKRAMAGLSSLMYWAHCEVSAQIMSDVMGLSIHSERNWALGVRMQANRRPPGLEWKKNK